MTKKEFIEHTTAELSESMPQLSKKDKRRIQEVLNKLKKGKFEAKGIPNIILDSLSDNEFSFVLEGKNDSDFSNKVFGKQQISLEALIDFINKNSKAIDNALNAEKDI